jgi:hypothetical protein
MLIRSLLLAEGGLLLDGGYLLDGGCLLSRRELGRLEVTFSVNKYEVKSR